MVLGSGQDPDGGLYVQSGQLLLQLSLSHSLGEESDFLGWSAAAGQRGDLAAELAGLIQRAVGAYVPAEGQRIGGLDQIFGAGAPLIGFAGFTSLAMSAMSPTTALAVGSLPAPRP